MRTSWLVALLTLLCCSISPAVTPGFAAQFEIYQDLNYSRMELPSTLGETTSIYWGFDVEDPEGWAHDHMSISFPDKFFRVLSMYGAADIGPLLSFDAEWNPDGSIGDAEYVFDKGEFALDLVVELQDDTRQTVQIRGATSRLRVIVDDDRPGLGGAYADLFDLTVPHATIDQSSAALFGIKPRISGDLSMVNDVNEYEDYSSGEIRREVALFGWMYFDYKPVRHAKSFDAQSVPAPTLLPLVGLGLVGIALRSRRR
jgi:hypothetical protein